MVSTGTVLNYEGCNHFRQRLVLSVLSGRSVRIKDIRKNDDDPGVRDFEVSFIRLLDKITNGSHIDVSSTGTTVYFRPGILFGGKYEHECPTSRGIGYFLEPLLMLGPFCKTPLYITLKGITNSESDPTVDMIKYSLMPTLKMFLVIEEGLSLKMVKRGLPPAGGGTVIFSCPVRRELKPFQWEDYGKVKRIRGVAYTSRVAPAIANRMIVAAKEVFKNYINDVYFTCDNGKGSSPGYGICCVAETNKGTFYSSDFTSSPAQNARNSVSNLPEDIGKFGAFRLLEEIYRCGSVDSLCQPLVLLFMVLTSKDVSKVVFGHLAPYTMSFLRHMRDFFQVTFKIDTYQKIILDEEEEEEKEEFKLGTQKLMLSCVGIGYTNVGKGQT